MVSLYEEKSVVYARTTFGVPVISMKTLNPSGENITRRGLVPVDLFNADDVGSRSIIVRVVALMYENEFSNKFVAMTRVPSGLNVIPCPHCTATFAPPLKNNCVPAVPAFASSRVPVAVSTMPIPLT